MPNKGCKLHRWTDEERMWLIEQFNPFKYTSDAELWAAFNERFNCCISFRAIQGMKERLKLHSHMQGQLSRKYTKEQDEWLISNARKYNNRLEVAQAFNNEFGTKFTKHEIEIHLDSLGAKCGCYFTKEQSAFLRDNISKYSYNELTELFNLEFGTGYSVKKIKMACQNRGLRLNNKVNEQRCGVRSKTFKPVGTIVVRNRERGLKKYLVKVDDIIGAEEKNWICIPKEVAFNNEVISNCALAYAEVKLCERDLPK